MGRLPLDSLSLLISVVEGGRSYKEVASDLGVARSTVERRIKGQLRRLQQAGALGSIRVDWLDSLVAIRRERETIMAAAGKQAEEILASSAKAGGYILVVEGGVPTKKGHGMIGNKEMLDVLNRIYAKYA